MASQQALPGLSETLSALSILAREPLPEPTTLELLVQGYLTLYEKDCSNFESLAIAMAIHLGDLFNVTDGYTAAEVVEYRHKKYLLGKLLPPHYDPRTGEGVLYPWDYKKEQLHSIAHRMLNVTTYTDLQCYNQESLQYSFSQVIYTDDACIDEQETGPGFVKQKTLKMESIQWLRSHVGLAASPHFDGEDGFRIESVVRLILREHHENPLLGCRYASDVVRKVNSYEPMKDVYVPWTAIPFVLIRVALKFNPCWEHLKTWFDQEVHDDEQKNTDWISVFTAINGTNPNPPALPKSACLASS